MESCVLHKLIFTSIIIIIITVIIVCHNCHYKHQHHGDSLIPMHEPGKICDNRHIILLPKATTHWNKLINLETEATEKTSSAQEALPTDHLRVLREETHCRVYFGLQFTNNYSILKINLTSFLFFFCHCTSVKKSHLFTAFKSSLCLKKTQKTLATRGKLLKDREEHLFGFPGHIILDWNELRWTLKRASLLKMCTLSCVPRKGVLSFLNLLFVSMLL